jgi:hypothetical protein
MQPDDQNLQSPLQKKAMAKLMGLQFKISYMKGSENVAAIVSGQPRDVHSGLLCCSTSLVTGGDKFLRYRHQSTTETTELAIHTPDEHGYDLQQGIIRFQGRVWVGLTRRCKPR